MVSQLMIIGLLAILWLPIFVLAGYLQLLSSWVRQKPVVRLLTLLVAEIGVALVIWLSPLHKFLPKLNLTGLYDFGQIPFISGVIAACIITSAVLLCTRVSLGDSSKGVELGPR